MKLHDYLLKFKNQPCPYCGAETVSFRKRSDIAHPMNKEVCKNCGVVLKYKKFNFFDLTAILLWTYWCVTASYSRYKVILLCCGVLLALAYVFLVIPFIPVRYESDYKHPESGSPEDWRSPKKYADKDIDNYKIFGNFVFSLIDGGLLHVGYKSKNYDFISLCSQQLKEILEQNNYSMTLIVLDKDVILFQTDNVTKAFCGIAATRNGVAPEDSENTPEFDKYLFYQKIKDNIYYFQGEI